MQIRELTYWAIALRIVAAIFLGGIMGLERGLKNRAAGFRTYMLVCVGACLIMMINQYIFQVYGVGDPVRMGAQVISGIGFLGAGSIIVTRSNQIKGLTTAAGLWTSAGVGLALGIGFYEAAFIGALAVFFVMTMLQRLDNRMHRKTKNTDIYLELTDMTSLGGFMRQAQAKQLDVTNLQFEYTARGGTGLHAYIISIKSRQRRITAEILDDIRTIDGVNYVEQL